MANKIKSLTYYKTCFLRLNRSVRKGEKAPHKPVLLLAMIDRVEQLLSMGVAGHRMINQNLIDLNPKLEQFFYNNWNLHVESELFSPSFSTPFFHMEGEPFWKLALKKDAKPQGSQGESHLYKYYLGAYIDEELMLLLLEDDARNELRQLLIETIRKKDLEIPFDEPASADMSEAKTLDLREVHLKFWTRFIDYSNQHGGLFASRKPSKDQWLTHTENGVIVSIVLKKTSCAVELNIKEESKEKSDAVFNRLLKDKAHIEVELGPMVWHFKENSISAKIYQEIARSFLVSQDESAIFQFFTERSAKFVKVFEPYFSQSSASEVPNAEQSCEWPSEDEMCKLFQDYMRNNGTSEGSIKKYSIQVARNAEVRAIVEKIIGKDSLYKVFTPEDASKVRVEVKSSPCDVKGNHMYSVGISHYIKFLTAIATTLPKCSEKASTSEGKKRNGWSDDEMILSLDLYFRTPYNKRTRNNPEIIELAKLIGRTPASVVLRMANYLCFDVEEQKLGHKGMDGGTRQCKPFWEKYVDNRELLHKQAMEIKLSKQHSEKK